MSAHEATLTPRTRGPLSDEERDRIDAYWLSLIHI